MNQNNVKICDLHKKEISVLCVEQNCKRRLLCTNCFKLHANHLKYFISFNEAVDVNGNINGIAKSLLELDITHKENFKNKVNSLIKPYQDEILLLTSEFHTDLLDTLKNEKNSKFFEEVQFLIENDQSLNFDLSKSVIFFKKYKILEENIELNEKLYENFIPTIEKVTQGVVDKMKSLYNNCLQNMKGKIKCVNEPRLKFEKDFEILSFEAMKNTSYTALVDNGKVIIINHNQPKVYLYESLEDISSNKYKVYTIPDQIIEKPVYLKGCLFYIKLNNEIKIIKYHLEKKMIVLELIIPIQKDEPRLFVKGSNNNSLFQINTNNNNKSIFNFVKEEGFSFNKVDNQSSFASQFVKDEFNLIDDNNNLYLIYSKSFNICISEINSEKLSVIKSWELEARFFKNLRHCFIIDQEVYFLSSFSGIININNCYDLISTKISELNIELDRIEDTFTSVHYDKKSNCLFLTTNNLIFKYRVMIK